MVTEIFVAGKRLDLTADIASLLTFAIDDIKDFASRQTTFSKTVVLPGTANNNAIFGNIFDTGISNDYDPTLPNIGINYNPSVSAPCLIFQDNLQTFKGTLRIMEIDVDNGSIEYEVALNGNLTSLSVALSSAYLTDLDFSEYNLLWSVANISASWDNTPGSGVYFPLADLGTYSADKHNWDFRTFRPALYVKEYIDKMFAAAGYAGAANMAGTLAGKAASAAIIAAGGSTADATAAYTAAYATAYAAAKLANSNAPFRYDSPLFQTDRFKRLVIPHNEKDLTKLTTSILSATSSASQHIINHTSGPNINSVIFGTVIGGLFTTTDNKVFTYIGTDTLSTTLNVHLQGTYDFEPIFPLSVTNYDVEITVLKNSANYYYDGAPLATNGFLRSYTKNMAVPITLATGDTFEVQYKLFGGTAGPADVFVTAASIGLVSSSTVSSPLDYNEEVDINNAIPKNIKQVDFLSSIVKLFNLYVYEDKFDEKLIYIRPFIDFYPGTSIDWTYKLNRRSSIKIQPMSELTSRIYNFYYTDDSDYWNDLYKKRYNQGYGSYILNTLYEFSTDSSTLTLIFASTPLVGYVGEDKVYPTIFKLSGTTEDRTDSVIRIMQTRKIMGVKSWSILSSLTSATTAANAAGTAAYNSVIAGSGGTVAAQTAYNSAYNAEFATFVIGTYTEYGYAGHFDDPDNPDNDLNFGALNQIFFVLTIGDLTKTQYNIYWSGYMSEITDKDSKMLTGKFYLTPKDIFNLDFSKYILVDGVLFRLNKITDYDSINPGDCEVQLLKVIQSSYSFPAGSIPEEDREIDWDVDQPLEYSAGNSLLYA